MTYDHKDYNETQSVTVIATYVKDTEANSVEKENTMFPGLIGGTIVGVSKASVLLLIIIAYVSMLFYWKKKDKAFKFLFQSYKRINNTIFKK